MGQKRGQYIFTINVPYQTLIGEHYDPIEQTNVIEYEELHSVDNSDKIHSFLDSNKNKINMWLTMVDMIDQKCLPVLTDKPCWWCKYTFTNTPIGLPLKYYPDSSDGPVREVVEKFLKEKNYCSDTIDYFETEGIFCSFSCCKAYILDHNFTSKYKKSMTLLSLMYLKLFGLQTSITRAPTWKLLERWGGPLSIDDFRSQKFMYNVTPNIKRPFMFTTGVYVEELKSK